MSKLETTSMIPLFFFQDGRPQLGSFPATQIVATFSSTHRVIALDPRGHGHSECAISGYRVSGLAKALDHLLDHLNVKHAIVLGHSTSCAVIWNFIELFGQERLQSIILVDQMLCHIKPPTWSED